MNNCHLAHKFSQTCRLSLSGLCDAAIAFSMIPLSSAGSALSCEYSDFYSPLKCYTIIVVVWLQVRLDFILALSREVLGRLWMISRINVASC